IASANFPASREKTGRFSPSAVLPPAKSMACGRISAARQGIFVPCRGPGRELAGNCEAATIIDRAAGKFPVFPEETGNFVVLPCSAAVWHEKAVPGYNRELREL